MCSRARRGGRSKGEGGNIRAAGQVQYIPTEWKQWRQLRPPPWATGTPPAGADRPADGRGCPSVLGLDSGQRCDEASDGPEIAAGSISSFCQKRRRGTPVSVGGWGRGGERKGLEHREAMRAREYRSVELSMNFRGRRHAAEPAQRAGGAGFGEAAYLADVSFPFPLEADDQAGGGGVRGETDARAGYQVRGRCGKRRRNQFRMNG